jgi:hypothetical protein
VETKDYGIRTFEQLEAAGELPETIDGLTIAEAREAGYTAVLFNHNGRTLARLREVELTTPPNKVWTVSNAVSGPFYREHRGHLLDRVREVRDRYGRATAKLWQGLLAALRQDRPTDWR